MLSNTLSGENTKLLDLFVFSQISELKHFPESFFCYYYYLDLYCIDDFSILKNCWVVLSYFWHMHRKFREIICIISYFYIVSKQKVFDNCFCKDLAKFFILPNLMIKLVCRE